VWNRVHVILEIFTKIAMTSVECANQAFVNLPLNAVGPLTSNCTHTPVDPSRQVPQLITSFNVSKYENHGYLDAASKFGLYWSVDHVQGVISLAVDVQTDGWVGLGFSETGAMQGSDVSIGWIGCDGSVNHRDRFATEYALPPEDIFQDFYDIRGGIFNDNDTSLPPHSPAQCLAPVAPESTSLTTAEKVALGLGVAFAVILTVFAGVYLLKRNKRKLPRVASDEDESTSGLFDQGTSGRTNARVGSYTNLEK